VHDFETLNGRMWKHHHRIAVSTAPRLSLGAPLNSLKKYIELQKVESDDEYSRIDSDSYGASTRS